MIYFSLSENSPLKATNLKDGPHSWTGKRCRRECATNTTAIAASAEGRRGPLSGHIEKAISGFEEWSHEAWRDGPHERKDNAHSSTPAGWVLEDSSRNKHR